MKIKKGDQVLIILGKDRNKTGKVEKVLPKKQKLVVSGLNMRKKHLKPSKKNPKGGVMEFAAAIYISDVMLICPKCNKPGRVSFEVKNDKKERKCKECGEIIWKQD